MGRLALRMYSNLYYRCGPCDLNMPYEEQFAHCPVCETPTASRNSSRVEVLTVEEIRYIQFEHFLNDETTEQRDQRRIALEVDERMRAERSARFFEVVAGAGFQDWERQRHEELEAQFATTILSTPIRRRP